MFRSRSSCRILFAASTKNLLHQFSPPKTGIPQDMSAELSGTPNVAWLNSLPKFAKLMSESNSQMLSSDNNASLLPPSEQFWQSPTHEALDKLSDCVSYFEILRYISENGMFFLIPKAILAEDAPLPHVAYEDIMNALFTCSMQKPPEEQFQLPGTVVRLLLCTAAHHILHDRHYFTTVESWFRNSIERQQNLGSEAWSAWVMCCVAANRVDLAVLFLQHMENSQIQFDPIVFNFLLHPSETIQSESGIPSSSSKPSILSQHLMKGFILQQRLLKEMLVQDGTVAAGIHAMFVFYAITRQTVQQWETIRVAVSAAIRERQQNQQNQIHVNKKPTVFISQRTLKMIKSVFKKEKGQRCGPLTMRSLVSLFAQEGDIFHTCLALSYLRKREVEEHRMSLLESQSTSTVSSVEEMSVVPVKFSKQEKREILKYFMLFDKQEKQQEQNDESTNNNMQNNNNNNNNNKISQELSLHLPLLEKLLDHDVSDINKENSSSLYSLQVPDAISQALFDSKKNVTKKKQQQKSVNFPKKITSSETEFKQALREQEELNFNESKAESTMSMMYVNAEKREQDRIEKELIEKSRTGWFSPE